MSHQDLTKALAKLSQELSDAGNLDAGDVDQLRATMNEIQAILDRKTADAESLTERVTSSAKRFEQSHPVLTESLGRIADILQQMGI